MIYKREPRIRTLPTGSADMDAVKFSNINSIAGLQHVDNPLAAAQNGTYDCKNVYQDESNNLTVRPSIRCLHNIALSEDDELIGYHKAGNKTLLHVKRGELYFLSDGSAEVEIGAGNITIQTFEDNIYVLYSDTTGKLKFKQWNDGLVDFEPDILPNTKTPVSRLYNLLTDQIKMQSFVDRRRVLTDDDYTYEKSISVESSDPLLQVEASIQILKNGDILVAAGRHSYLLRNSLDWEVIELDGYLSSDGVLSDHSSAGYVALYYISSGASSAAMYRERISVLGTVTETEWHVNFTLTDIDTPGTAFASATGYDGYFAVGSVFDGGYRVIVIKDGEILQTITARGDELASGVGRNIDLYMSRGLLCVRRYDGELYHYHFYTLGDIIQPLNSAYMVSSHILPVYTSESNIYVVDGDIIYYSYSTKEGEGNQSLELDFQISDNVKLYTEPNLAIRTEDKLYLVDLDKGSKELGLANIEQLCAVNGDGTIFAKATVTDNTLVVTAVSRSLKPEYAYGKREVTDSLPVLSEITDTVLTSFYLDNIYWFVTKHRVFGTGVADGEFSIKYFDPRKYFHFDEELTGAIRISDNSFWVFHNDGAYLIYKSSSEFYDELTGDYITMITWLCTSTAKSKGCDFENAVMTLPVTSYVCCVTSDDISTIQMRENVQTDDRILVPMTLGIRKFTESLLSETTSVLTGVFRYNALFFLNKAGGGVRVLVYNATTEDWWYWELPLDKVISVENTETNIEFVGISDNKPRVYDLYTDYHEYKTGALTYSIYADRVEFNKPSKIDWFWNSCIMHFNVLDYKKQLLFTNFTLGERDSVNMSFEYNFDIYDEDYVKTGSTDITTIVERVKTYSCKNIIGKFMYLQLCLRDLDDDSFSSFAKTKISAITLKYRILSGGLL